MNEALAWPYLAESWPAKLFIDLFAQHQPFAVCCLPIENKLPLKVKCYEMWEVVRCYRQRFKNDVPKYFGMRF